MFSLLSPIVNKTSKFDDFPQTSSCIVLQQFNTWPKFKHSLSKHTHTHTGTEASPNPSVLLPHTFFAVFLSFVFSQLPLLFCPTLLYASSVFLSVALSLLLSHSQRGQRSLIWHEGADQEEKQESSRRKGGEEEEEMEAEEEEESLNLSPTAAKTLRRHLGSAKLHLIIAQSKYKIRFLLSAWWYIAKVVPPVSFCQPGVCLTLSRRVMIFGKRCCCWVFQTSVFVSLSSTSEVPSGSMRLERRHTPLQLRSTALTHSCTIWWWIIVTKSETQRTSGA